MVLRTRDGELCLEGSHACSKFEAGCVGAEQEVAGSCAAGWKPGSAVVRDSAAYVKGTGWTRVK